MSKLKEITQYLESAAPLPLQESYDNAGLIVGSPETEVSSIIISLDVTEEVVDEAINNKVGLIVAHHPIIFSGLKKITGKKLCGTHLAESHKKRHSHLRCPHKPG